ncbi:TCR/Tet family MFS transporter [Rhodalgimonas zhirmunskyi]|uniref:TCR/Tet family MFS transporter n=1 Tax=Rhodalgimonas zhirmunskyi TaxID=2964767 RepID=A0AAJ1X5J7_9RHOB|nr:TCR/Tet family MFS transporter [Rhodoalgimonas zhirmunskyi]MDQ2094596.1 TCR/Tet family MFS transporter [Rhodoalgimonas zhirmunskyi]
MNNRLALTFILLTVGIDAMGIGLILPVMPGLITEIEGGTLSEAAVWGGVLSTAFAVMQFLFAPLLGALSDRFGRRPVLLASLLVMALDYVVMALAGAMWILLAGRLVGGVTAATHSTAMAYVADISKPHEKAARFGLVGAGFGVGFVLGPVLGGMLAEYGTRAPFWAAAALALANAALGAFVLRETVTDAIRRPFSAARANPFGALRQVSALPGLGALITVYFLYQVASMVYPAIWAYFTTLRFGWSEATVGLSLGIYGAFFGLVQGLAVRPAMARLGYRGTVLFAFGVDIIALVLVGLLTSGTMVLWLIPFMALGAVGLPAIQGTMSAVIADDAQGELQGVLTSVTSFAMIVTPLAMTQVFAWFTRPDAVLYLPGAPFLLSALLMVLCTVLFLRSSVPSSPH